MFLSIAISQLAAFAASNAATQLLQQLPINVGTIPNDPNQLLDTATKTLKEPSVQSALTGAQAFIGAVASSMFMMFLSLLLGFFLLVSDERLARWGKEQILGNDALSIDFLAAVDEGLNSIYFGYTLTIFVIMILTAIIYNVFNFFAPGNLSDPSDDTTGGHHGYLYARAAGRSIRRLSRDRCCSRSRSDSTGANRPFVPDCIFLFMTLAFDNVVRTYIRPYLSGKNVPPLARHVRLSARPDPCSAGTASSSARS